MLVSDDEEEKEVRTFLLNICDHCLFRSGTGSTDRHGRVRLDDISFLMMSSPVYVGITILFSPHVQKLCLVKANNDNNNSSSRTTL